MRCIKPIHLLLLLSFVYSFSCLTTYGQIVSGPMLGQVEIRTAKLWIEVKPGTPVELWYWKKGAIASAKKINSPTQNKWFAPLTFDLVGLDMNTTYEYQFITTNKGTKPTKADGEFTTKDLWQHRKPAPDFSFLTGSCAYVNEAIFDRPGDPYGKDSSIFKTMTREKAAFMLWLGDNWYLREADFFDNWGLWYRASHDRSLPVLQPFLKAMPHYAIWDDHDYGPNNADKSYHLKEESRKVFMSYWGNPSYGLNNEGVYTKLSYGDVDLFLMDDRYFRSADFMEPLIDGKPNPEKRMWGAKQMEWLKNALLNSYAPFKIIVTGSQTLNTLSTQDCLQSYPIEFNELMDFLINERINGVLFLTGDRHHSEVLGYERKNAYTLYDITSSSLTAGVSKVAGKEKDNPARAANTLVEVNNYSRISITGKRQERKFTVEFINTQGQKQGEWSINETDLRMPARQ